MRYDTARRRLLALTLATASTVACTDQLTEPNTASTSSAQLATSSAATPTPDLRASAASTLAWQARARNLVTTHPATVSPIVAARAYALLGMAQYGAAVAADRSLGIATADDDGSTMTGADEGGRAQYEARRGAIGAASNRILSHLFPDVAAAMDQQLATEGVGPNGRVHPQFTRGLATGRAMGDVMVAWANADGFSVPWTNPPFAPYLSGTPGVWFQANPLAAPAGYQFPGMTPYFLTSAHQFRSAPPPVYLSPEYNAGLATVRSISDTRTADQIASANFWNLSAGSPTALGYWDQRAAEYIVEHGLGERSASHVFALTNAAALDATIGCWDAKYTYLLLRPRQADGAITLVFPSPNHPSYPSGHSCVSAAAAGVLSAFFPEKKPELDQGVAAAGISRVFAGIHYPFDISAGQTLGRSVAAWALDYDRTRGLLTAVGR